MGSKLRILEFLVLAAAVGLAACDDSGDTDGAGGAMPMGGTPMGGTPMGGAPMGGGMDPATISLSGMATEWLSGTPGGAFTVCLHETETCTMTAEDGSFSLDGLPAESEILLTFVGADNARIAFPLVTGTEDMVVPGNMTIVSRSTADIMLALAGEESGVDDTKSILTFYAGIGGFPQGRGIAGIEVTYDGPDTEKSPSFIVPVPMAPGASVGGADVTATTRAGNGFVPNIAPGDYTITFAAAERTCTPLFAWPGAEGSAPNTFRTQLIEGFATFTFVNCRTENTISTTGTIVDFITDEPVVDGEACFHWDRNEDGSYANTQCAQTDAMGSVSHTDIPGDTRIMARFVKDSYMTIVGTFEALTEDVIWGGFAAPEVAVIAAAAGAGVTVDETKGHVIFNVFNPDGETLDGYTLTVQDGDQTALYASGAAFDPALTETSTSGGAAILNLEPGDYTFLLNKEGVLCVPSPWSWLGGGYTAPIEANAITQIAVHCIDTPTALFGEPAEPVDPPMCVADDAEASCNDVCRQFVECAFALCPGLQDINDWETSIAGNGMAQACQIGCVETPQLIDVICEHSTCNETLTVVVNTQDGYEEFCNAGFSSILETAAAASAAPDSNLTQVAALATSSDAALGILAGEGPMTIFLPVDAAFEALDPALLEMVGTDPALRDTVLTYHVVPMGLPSGAVVEAAAGGLDTVDTLGGPISLEVTDDGDVIVGGATVITADIFASNGVIHLIDAVILPPPAEDGE